MAERQHDFTPRGTEVRLDDLLALRWLAEDPQRLPPKRVRGARLGDFRSPFRGQGREFAELRRYQPGDDVRRIDWRVTARKQHPYVQVMEEDRQVAQLIWLDFSTASYFGSHRVFKSVLACHWAAFLAWRQVSAKHPTTALITGAGAEQPLPLRRTGDVAQYCQALVEAHRALAEGYQSGIRCPQLTRVWPYLTGRPCVWLLSDLAHWSPEALDQALPPGRLQQLVVLQSYDELERELPNVGPVEIAGESAAAVLDTGSGRVRRAHHDRFEARDRAWRNWAERRGAVRLTYTPQSFSWQQVRSWPLQQ